MRRLPPALDDALRGGATTLCHGWRITRRDGQVLGFTDHDRDLVLDGLLLRAGAGIAGSESVVAQGLAVTGTELSGALSDAALDAADLAAGRYDGAQVDLLLIDWSTPANTLLLRRGTLGEVRREGGAFFAEVRSLSDALNQMRGRVFGALCDADLGDARCGVDLSGGHSVERSITAVEGPLALSIDGLSAAADGAFTQGRLVFLSGANAGFASEVKSQVGARVLLWQRPPEPVAPGDAVRLAAGCDKRFFTCRDRFANALNFRGFPHMPGNDFVVAIAVPGEGGHDGAVLS